MQLERFESRRNEARLGLQKLQAQPCVNLLEAGPGALMRAREEEEEVMQKCCN